MSDERGTRIYLTRFEVQHLLSFAESVDPGDDDSNIARWDRLAQKLENAIARIDNTEPRDMRTPTSLRSEPDQQPAMCRNCGWEGTLTKTGPCPQCGSKVNPLLFYSTRKHAP